MSLFSSAVEEVPQVQKSMTNTVADEKEKRNEDWGIVMTYQDYSSHQLRSLWMSLMVTAKT